MRWYKNFTGLVRLYQRSGTKIGTREIVVTTIDENDRTDKRIVVELFFGGKHIVPAWQQCWLLLSRLQNFV